MTYTSFDEFSKEALHKEREACFTAGSSGEKLAQYITDAKDRHSKNVGSLKHTVFLFAGDEPKRRLHGKVSSRLEQEQKWVTHYATCAAEHKKGEQIHKLKMELVEYKKTVAAKEQALRKQHLENLEETRKQCRIQYRAEFEAEQKSKKEEADKANEESASKKQGLFGWLKGLFSRKPKAKVDKPKPAPMTAKSAVEIAKGLDPVQRREFLMKKLEENRAKRAEVAKG